MTSSFGFCSYTLAINFQEKVAEAWESHGPSAQDELREARRLLEQLKKKAHGVLSEQAAMKALPLSQTSKFVSARSSQPGVTVSKKLPKAV